MKDLKVENYDGIMACENTELFKEGVEVKHEKFVKFNYIEEVLRTDLKLMMK